MIVPKDRIIEIALLDVYFKNGVKFPRSEKPNVATREKKGESSGLIHDDPFLTSNYFISLHNSFKDDFKVQRDINHQVSNVDLVKGSIRVASKEWSAHCNGSQSAFYCGKTIAWEGLCRDNRLIIPQAVAWHQTLAHELTHYAGVKRSGIIRKIFRFSSPLLATLSFIITLTSLLSMSVIFFKTHHINLTLLLSSLIALIIFFIMMYDTKSFPTFLIPKRLGYFTYAGEELIAEIGNILLLEGAGLLEKWPENSIYYMAFFLRKFKKKDFDFIIKKSETEAKKRIAWILEKSFPDQNRTYKSR